MQYALCPSWAWCFIEPRDGPEGEADRCVGGGGRLASALEAPATTRGEKEAETIPGRQIAEGGMTPLPFRHGPTDDSPSTPSRSNGAGGYG